MAAKFVDLNEAAKMLGVSPDELVEMRSRGDIFGVRKGASWEFKVDEVQRVLDERNPSSSPIGLDDDLDLGLDDSSHSASESIAGESILLEGEEDGRRSTIIGQQGGKPAHDSDLKLKSPGSSLDDDLELAPASGVLGTVAKPAAPQPQSGDSLGFAGSELILGGEDSVAKPRSPASDSARDSLNLGQDLEFEKGSSAGSFGAGDSINAGDSLAMGDSISVGDSISLDDEPVIGSAPGTGSHGSGRRLSAGDSGINLRPGDSGLSLEEEPLDLGGSVVESLELPEDSDVVALEEDSADPDQATQLKQDDQFLLSPSDELSEEESDSGSQVIALDDSLALDGDAATMLGGKAAGASGIGQPDFAASGMGSDYGAMGMGSGAAMGMGAGQPVYVPVEVEEIPYSIWNVLGLLLVAFVMAMCAMLMVDVVLNLWVWNEQTSASMFLMDNLLKTFGLDN